MTHVEPVSLDSVRFAPERDLIASLTERFGLDVLVDHFVGSGGVRSAYDEVLGSKLATTRFGSWVST